MAEGEAREILSVRVSGGLNFLALGWRRTSAGRDGEEL